MTSQLLEHLYEFHFNDHVGQLKVYLLAFFASVGYMAVAGILLSMSQQSVVIGGLGVAVTLTVFVPLAYATYQIYRERAMNESVTEFAALQATLADAITHEMPETKRELEAIIRALRNSLEDLTVEINQEREETLGALLTFPSGTKSKLTFDKTRLAALYAEVMLPSLLGANSFHNHSWLQSGLMYSSTELLSKRLALKISNLECEKKKHDSELMKVIFVNWMASSLWEQVNEEIFQEEERMKFTTNDILSTLGN
jgi:hypothetical protein